MPHGGRGWQAAGLVGEGLGRHYHFVGRPGAGLRGRAGGQLQAPPLLLHGAALVPPHAVDLLLHAHLHLPLARKQCTLGAFLLRWENRALTSVPQLPPNVSHQPQPKAWPSSCGCPATCGHCRCHRRDEEQMFCKHRWPLQHAAAM